MWRPPWWRSRGDAKCQQVIVCSEPGCCVPLRRCGCAVLSLVASQLCPEGPRREEGAGGDHSTSAAEDTCGEQTARGLRLVALALAVGSLLVSSGVVAKQHLTAVRGVGK